MLLKIINRQGSNFACLLKGCELLELLYEYLIDLPFLPYQVSTLKFKGNICQF